MLFHFFIFSDELEGELETYTFHPFKVHKSEAASKTSEYLADLLL